MKRLIKKVSNIEKLSKVLDLRRKQSPDNVINLLNRPISPNVIDMTNKGLSSNVLDLRNISKVEQYDSLEDYYKEHGMVE